MDEEAVRLYLHQVLDENFPDAPSYYRPPGNITFDRPCILYTNLNVEPSFANNTAYILGSRFQITILSDLPGYSNKWTMFRLPNVVVVGDNSYVSDDVVHDVFTVTVNAI